MSSYLSSSCQLQVWSLTCTSMLLQVSYRGHLWNEKVSGFFYLPHIHLILFNIAGFHANILHILLPGFNRPISGLFVTTDTTFWQTNRFEQGLPILPSESAPASPSSSPSDSLSKSSELSTTTLWWWNMVLGRNICGCWAVVAWDRTKCVQFFFFELCIYWRWTWARFY